MSDQETTLPSQRPYLLRAMRDWIADCGRTPYIVVDAAQPGVSVPANHVKDGKIVLNISAEATDVLSIDNDWMRFRTRFAGQVAEIAIPIAAVLSIYAHEAGQGMIFTDTDTTQPEPPTPAPSPTEGNPGTKRSHLKVVK